MIIGLNFYHILTDENIEALKEEMEILESDSMEYVRSAEALEEGGITINEVEEFRSDESDELWSILTDTPRPPKTDYTLSYIKKDGLGNYSFVISYNGWNPVGGRVMWIEDGELENQHSVRPEELGINEFTPPE